MTDHKLPEPTTGAEAALARALREQGWERCPTKTYTWDGAKPVTRARYLAGAAELLAALDPGPVVPDSAFCDHDDVKTDDYGAMRCTHCGLVF